MKITRYGITLERLNESSIETVRRWRNDPKISRFMFYKGEITADMQREWFNSIDNEQNFFFLIHVKGELAGLINISSIDWENKTAFTGLFIYDDKFLGTDVPVRSSLAMLDVFFLLFDVQVVYAKVKGSNKVAHLYNTSLGFNRTKKIEYGLGYEYTLQKEIYLSETKKIRNAAMRLNGNETLIELNGAKTDTWLREKLENAKKDVVEDLGVRVI